MKRPALLFLCGGALLVVFALRGILNPWTDRLPGIDSGNLYAWEVYTRSVLAAGHLPFWNPYHFAGTPHLADPQTTVLYPPALLLRWLPVPAYLGWMIAIHLWIAGAGTLFAARAIGLGWMSASASAVAVMLGGSVPGWIHDGHLLLMYSVAWVPWAFGLAVVSVNAGRTLPDGRLVTVLVLQFLSGYLQGSLYLAGALAFYYLFSAAWPPASAVSGTITPVRRWVPIAQLGTLAILCAAASAFLLLPAATLVAQSGRSAGLSYSEALTGSWHGRDLATLLFPFYGVTDSPPHRYLSDRLAYVGWMLTVFTPFAFFRRDRLRISIFLGLLAALVCALALGDTGGLFRLQYQLLPGLRVPGRVLFMATLSLALLGAIGLEAFLALATDRSRRLVIPAVLSSVAVVAATSIASKSPQEVPAGPGWPWMPVALLGCIVAVGMLALVDLRRLALVVALAAVVADVTTLTAGAVNTVPIEADATIRQWIGAPVGARAISLCESRVGAREFLQNRQPTLDGLPGLHLRDYADWAFIAKSGDVPPLGGLYHRIGSEGGESPARSDLIDMANAARVVTCTHDTNGRLTGLTVQRNDQAWPRAMWVCSAEDVSRREAIAQMIRGRYDRAGNLEPRRYIKVRWAPTVDKARQTELEHVHHLQAGVLLEGVTWRYLLGDASVDAVLAIMRDPGVEDTHGVDRATGVFTPTAELQDSIPEIAGDDNLRMLLPGAHPCGRPAAVDVDVMDRPDGYVSAHVDAPTDGFLFFSEPSYPDRRATIDGHAVPAVKANLAFTAVAVPAGRHHVELRYRPSSFYLGSAVSLMTAIGYAAAFVRRPRAEGIAT